MRMMTSQHTTVHLGVGAMVDAAASMAKLAAKQAGLAASQSGMNPDEMPLPQLSAEVRSTMACEIITFPFEVRRPIEPPLTWFLLPRLPHISILRHISHPLSKRNG